MKILTYFGYVLVILLVGGTSFSMASYSVNEPSHENFTAFLQDVKQELKKKKIAPELLDEALGKNPQPDESVIEKLNNQPESVMTFNEYHSRIVSKERIRKGKSNFRNNRKELAEKSKQYNIPAETIVALWGVETAYGKLTGGHSIVKSLATLAYKSHRKEFFRKELIKSLQIVQDGHIPLKDLIGSWAGAMGQCQFMPSSFYRFAQDGNGDGKKDIWNTRADVFASAANYLKKSGWKDERWGQPVTLTKTLPSIDMSRQGLSEHQTIKKWKKLGVQPKTGGFHITNDKRKARLFIPNGPSGEAYLVYNNFDVILKWNNSSYFAYSVLSLSDKLGESQKNKL